MKGRVLCCGLMLLLMMDLILCIDRVQYDFKRYTYRKKRDEKKYKNAKSLCEVKQECLSLIGSNQSMCIRKCISEFCFKELYANDLLEEGEIDIRLNSFKGCLAQEKNRNLYVQDADLGFS